MKKWVPLLSSGIIGALLVVLGVTFNIFKLGPPAPPPPPPPSPLPTPMCEATVKLSLVSDGTPHGKKIVADPAHPVCLAVGQPMNWEIVSGGTVTIDFVENNDHGKLKGPFPRQDGSVINPHRGIYAAKHDPTVSPSLKIKSRGAEDLPGPWEYKVNWVTLDNQPVPQLDPVVCIRR